MPISIQPTGADLFDSCADILVNPVNIQGVMGAGLALQFKRRFPAMFEAYRSRCRSGVVRTGEVDVHVAEDAASRRRVVVANLPTKRLWRDGSRIEWIDQGLAALPRVITEHHAGSIAIPPLGCGLGGLDWALVHARITEALAPVAEAGVDVLVYPPAQHRSLR